MVKGSEIGDFGGGSARAPEAVAGIPLAGADPGSAELHRATRRALRRHRSRAGAPNPNHFDHGEGAQELSMQWRHGALTWTSAAAQRRASGAPARGGDPGGITSEPHVLGLRTGCRVGQPPSGSACCALATPPWPTPPGHPPEACRANGG